MVDAVDMVVDAPDTPDVPDAPDGTLADGTGADKVVTAPADWPADWREKAAGGDEALLKRLGRMKSPLDVVKSWENANKKISGLKPDKPEGDDPEALNKWRQAVGLPVEPNGYLENLDGLVLGDEDKALADSFLKDMHAQDADPKVVHKALQWYQNLKEQAIVDQANKDKENRTTNDDLLHEEWGNEYRPNLNGMHAIFDTYGDEGLKPKLFAARYPDGTLVGDDPAFLKMMVGLSRELNPHGTVTPAGGQTPVQAIDDEIAQLKTEMADTKGAKFDYWKNPTKQARYRELLDLKEKYGKRA